MLLCVVESSGSSPGRQGFKMAVAEDAMTGSIGGGIMEHKFVEMAREKLFETEMALIRKQFHRKSAVKDQSGMICSGEQSILFYRLNENSLPAIRKIISTLEENKNGVLEISGPAFSFSAESDREIDFAFRQKTETDFIYKERIGFRNHLYIIGGGHCALALSKLMSSMDFCIHLYEEREEINTLLENEFVHEKKTVKSYAELPELIPPGAQHYVVIMTFGYRTDDLALRSLIGKDFRYTGVLGSASKMKVLFSEWRRDGLPESRLKKIFAPVGIDIGSRTPEEIAVSIAAQLIQVKNS